MLTKVELPNQPNLPTRCVVGVKTTSKLPSESNKLPTVPEKVSAPKKVNCYFKAPVQNGKSIDDITTDTSRGLTAKEDFSFDEVYETLRGLLSSDSSKTSSSVIDLNWLFKQKESLAKANSDAILKKSKVDASTQTESSPPVADFSQVARHFAQASSGVTQLVQHLEIASLADASTSVAGYINVLEKLAQDYIELVKMASKHDLSVLSSV